jgi:hypothetical protein
VLYEDSHLNDVNEIQSVMLVLVNKYRVCIHTVSNGGGSGYVKSMYRSYTLCI